MPAVYAAADVMLFTSYQENCPLAPIEAAACGMPVVFRNIVEYKSLYHNSYLKAKNTNEFIEITNRLKENKAFYEEGLRISSSLISQFDHQTIREKLLNIYQKLDSTKVQQLFPSWV